MQRHQSASLKDQRYYNPFPFVNTDHIDYTNPTHFSQRDVIFVYILFILNKHYK